MNIQIHIADSFCGHYMPFLLFRECFFSILSHYYKDDTSVSVSYVNDLTELSKDSIILLNMYDLTLWGKNKETRHLLSTISSTFIIVNTEHWETRGAKEVFELITNKKLSNVILIEYNIINYRNISLHYPTINSLFLPLIYNRCIENYYQGYVSKKLSWDDKDIDVLFYGGVNERRRGVIDKLTNHKLHIVDSHHGVSNMELCNLIERSKIVINVLYYDFNIIFDYYRNTLLLANNALLVTETPQEMDESIEYWLEDMSSCMVTTSYDKLVECVESYLTKDTSEINDVLQRQHHWFKQTDMADILVPFFEYYQIQGFFPDSSSP